VGKYQPIFPFALPQTTAMGSSVYVPLNPELLTWARQSAGYDLQAAASRLGISDEKLAAIEAGEVQITYPQLRKAAEVYKRALAAFFMAAPPEIKQPPADFRMQQGIADRPLSPALNFELRKAWQHREDALELAMQLGQEFVIFEASASLGQAPDVVAKQVRSLLNISIEEQLKWRDSRVALNAWKNAVEALNVLVFEASRIPLEEMRGVSLWGDPLPVILLNGGDSLTGRAFSLIHEFTHLLLRQGGICDLAPSDMDSQAARIEAFCNAVAGATLVPSEVLGKLLDDGHTADWSIAELEELAAHFQVSKEVVLRRLLILGQTTERYYRRMRQEFIEEYRRLRQESRGDGGPSPAVMAVRNLGQPYVRLVLSAYYDNKIGLSTVSDYLGLKLKHLPRVESLIRRGGVAFA
jgi:Zn-dependent peptidase ImmA (M78 family)